MRADDGSWLRERPQQPVAGQHENVAHVVRAQKTALQERLLKEVCQRAKASSTVHTLMLEVGEPDGDVAAMLVAAEGHAEPPRKQITAAHTTSSWTLLLLVSGSSEQEGAVMCEDLT